MRKYLFFFIVVMTIAIAAVFMCRYSTDTKMFHGDALGYYSYLPSAFIYHNLKSIEQLPNDSTIDRMVLESAEIMKTKGLRTPKGYVINQYTYAVALMELPFFGVAHAYEKIKGYKANGYSPNYNIAIKTSSIVYSLLGLILTFFILRKYFDTLSCLVTTAMILLGTNLFWFTIHQPGMCHPLLFFLYALLILLTIKLYMEQKLYLFAVIGFLVGFITILRPTDFVSAFIPLCYGVYNKETFKERLPFIKRNLKGLLILVFFGIIPIIPQLVYWKEMTGSYFFYSYGEQSFIYLKHPKIIEGLFYFSNGFFPYAPVMVLALVGLLLYKYYKSWILPLCIICPLYAYLIYSWFGYNYPNGLGSRPMIHLYVLYAIPLAAFVQYIAKRKLVFKVLFVLIGLFLITVNYSVSRLKAENLLYSEETNMQYYTHMLYKTHMTYNDFLLHDIGEVQPDEGKLKKVATLAYLNFEDSVSNRFVPDNTNSFGSNYFYRLSEDEFPVDTIRLGYDKKIFKDAKWFKASGRFLTRCRESYLRHILSVSVIRGDKTIKWKGCVVDNKIGLADKTCNHAEEDYNIYHIDCNLWGRVYYYTAIPDDIKEGDKIELNIWNPFRTEVLIDDIRLEIYK